MESTPTLPATTGKVAVELTVNGRRHAVEVEPRKLLADVLREDCRVTGTHVGCEHGVCGACTVLIDGRPVRACLVFAVQAEGARIETIESVAAGGALDALQQALHEAHGVQCGFCTPGIVMTFEAYLRDNPSPTEAEVRDVLSGNLCRCTGYQNIVAAVMRAAATMRAGSGSGGGDAAADRAAALAAPVHGEGR